MSDSERRQYWQERLGHPLFPPDLLQEMLDTGRVVLEPAVDRSGALREVSLVPRPHSTVPTETPRREAVEDAQRLRGFLYHDDEANCWVYHHIDGDEPTPAQIADMVTEAERKLESSSRGVDRVSPGLETCPGCGEPMSYHDDEGFVL